MSTALIGLVVSALVAFGGVPLLLATLGRRLPPSHEASRSGFVAAPPARVFALLADPKLAPRWRKGVHFVRVLDTEPRLRFQERSGQGSLVLEVEEAVAPTRLVIRTAPMRRMVFSGTWTYALAPEDDGTRVTLTERGEVRSPIARLFMHHVLGEATNVNRTIDALQKHFARR